MKPAFASSRQAVAFIAMLVVTMGLPAVIARTGWMKREDAYRAIRWQQGPYPWIHQKIFKEQGDVDLVFIGSSRLWNDIHVPMVHEALSRQTGRDAEVFSLGHPWNGYDAEYVIARDLLERRRARMMVIIDEDNVPHPLAHRLIRYGENDDALEGLPVIDQLRMYGGAVLGMPRNLLSMVRENRLEDPANCRTNYWNNKYRAPHVALQHGALLGKLSWGGYEETKDFTSFTPPTVPDFHEVRIFSAGSKSAFTFTGAPMSDYQMHFARLLAKLCADHDTHLVMLHLPEFHSRHDATVVERREWPSALGAPTDLVGIPDAKLFAGLSEEQTRLLFYDDVHLNINGQPFFTAAILPALLQLNASTSH